MIAISLYHLGFKFQKDHHMHPEEFPKKLNDQATTIVGVMQGVVGLCIAWGFLSQAQSTSFSDPKTLEGLAFLVTGFLSAVKGFYTNK